MSTLARSASLADRLRACSARLELPEPLARGRTNYQERLKELSAAASGDLALQLAIGKAAYSLSFSNLPLEHTALWFENVAVSVGELQVVLEIFDRGFSGVGGHR